MVNKKIFFSYSRIDGEKFALKLATELREAGENVWIDQLDIIGGKLWDEEVERNLQACDCLIFIGTPQSTTSKNALNEVYYALDKGKLVIPVLFTSCDLPYRLNRLQYIDFTNEYRQAFLKLKRALGANDKLYNQNDFTSTQDLNTQSDKKQFFSTIYTEINKPVNPDVSFSKWYKVRFGKKSAFEQIVLWWLFGFIWIPLLYHVNKSEAANRAR